MASVPSSDKGAEVRDGASVFPTRRMQAAHGQVSLTVGREPVWLVDGDVALARPVPPEMSPFGFHPASFGDGANRFAEAQEAGIRWHRGLYAYWILVQPTDEDIRNGVFHWEKNDHEWGTVPASMGIVANIGLPERLVGWPTGARRGILPRPGSGVQWRLNQSEGAYLKFVKAVVRRYGGVGSDAMPGLTRPIRVWQVDNEPDLLSDDWKGYAHLQRITYRAIKEACPSATVLMGGQSGGGVRTFRSFYLPVLQELGGQCVDVYDLHYYGNARMDWQGIREPYRVIRGELDRLGYAKTAIWSTEMGTYSGTLVRRRPPSGNGPRPPQDGPRPGVAPPQPGEYPRPGASGSPRGMGPHPQGMPLTLPAGGPPADPPQTEREQARDAVKRHVYSLALGMGRVFWAFGLVEGFKFDGGFFDHTGFIYSGRFAGDPPRGTRKLAFYAYRQMTALLDGARWSEARILALGNHVHAIRIPRGHGTVTAVWYDPPYAPSDLLPAEALQIVRYRLERLGTGATSRETLIERFRTLADVIQTAVRTGGKDAVEPWAPRAEFMEVEQKVRTGADDAPSAVDRLLHKAREAFRR